MRKRILSTLLALCMVLGLVPGTARAEGETSGNCGADGSNVTWSFDESSGTLTISGSGAMADYDNDYQSTNRAPWSFYTNEELSDRIKAIEIESGVTTIGDFAFHMCHYVEKVKIPDTVVMIGEDAFGGCIELNSIQIPGSVKQIGRGAFSSCRKLSSIAIPEGVTTIEMATFLGCETLSNVSIPFSVTEIGNQAFQGCESISELPAMTNVSHIGISAFQECNGLTEVAIPDSVTYIGGEAFAECDNLARVTIPGSVTAIGTDYLDDWADSFHSCGKLTSITVSPDNVKYSSENGILYNKEKDILLCYPAGKTGKSYAVADSVVRIGSYAFSGCENLREISIPNGVIYIGFLAFAGCLELTSMTFPASVRRIESQAFGFYRDFGEKDWAITDLYFEGDAPNVEPYIDDGEHTTHSFPSDVTLHYRNGASDWTTPTWNGYKTEIWDGENPSPTPTPGDGGIVSLFPVNGATDVGYDASNPPVFKIEFDREIASAYDQEFVADVDLTMDGAFSIYRASDDKLIYKPTEYSGFAFALDTTKTVVTVTPMNNHMLLEPTTQYYITMGEGFVRFKDGTGSPAIEKGEWGFRTADVKCYGPLVKDGYFDFTSDVVDNDTIKYNYNYDESWFFIDNTTYQHDLAKMSIRAALAAYGAEGTKSTAKNITALMQELKYSNISTHYPTPQKDSIGYAIGSKNIISDSGEKCALLMVAIRGGTYFDEWGSNFLLGMGEEHYGFSTAADSVLDGLQEYIDTYKAKLHSNIKIWVVGYSRGAATANIVAKNLDDNKISGIKAKNVYAYCFECPQNTRGTNSTKYFNIINIVNPIDLIPKVAMSAWGYTRYGKTYYTPYRAGVVDSEYSTLRERMEEQYERIVSPYGITASTLIPGRITELALETDIIPGFLAYELADPETYCIMVQNHLVESAIDTFGIASKMPKYEKEVEFSTSISEFLGLDVLGPIIKDGIKNFLFKSHYGELCLSWIDSLEGDYSYADPKYRILFVNCPVDIEVYDSTNNLVGCIIKDTAQEIERGIFSYIDIDGQKTFILPNNMEYSIKMIATNGGKVTYTATEYNMDTGKTEKVVSYYQVEVEEGDILTGTAENLDEITSASYPLRLNDTEEITPSVDQSGNHVAEYNIDISVSGNGTAFGGGKYVNGKFAKVVATANSGETFLGWYVDNSLVSPETEYRFLVDRDIHVVARFTENNPATPDVPVNPNPNYPADSDNSSSSATMTYAISTPTSATGGKVIAFPASASRGTTVTLTALPDPGYELASLTVTDSKGNALELTDQGNGNYTFTMPGSKVDVSAVFQLIPAPEVPQTPWQNHYTDVAPDAWYYDAVQFTSEKGLMTGTTATEFSPAAPMTRAMLWTVLGRLDGADVSSVSGAWYAGAQVWSVEKGISDGTNPNGNVTRQELVTMLWRYKGSPAAAADLAAFTDSAAVTSWAAGAMEWAVSSGIIQGSGNALNPAGTATRAEVAAILMRFCESAQ